MKKYSIFTLALIMIMSVCFMFSGCAENADVITETTVPEFVTIMNDIEAMHQGYSDYMNAGENSVNYKTSDGFTPAETPCFVEYIESEDGTYKVCNMSFASDVSSEVHDEYQYINDTTTFIVRSYITDETREIVIEKYVVIDRVLYSINEEEGVFEAVEKPDTLDLYLSFAELTSLYGDFNA